MADWHPACKTAGMVPRPNPIGVKAATGWPPEVLLSPPDGNGADSESGAGWVSLWMSIWEPGQQAGSGQTAAEAVGEVRQAPAIGFLKRAGTHGEAADEGEPPEVESGLLPLATLCSSTSAVEPLRPSEWALTATAGPAGLLLRPPQKSPDAGAPELSDPVGEPVPVSADPLLPALPQPALEERAGKLAAAPADAPDRFRLESSAESGLLRAGAAMPDEIQPKGPARPEYLAAEMVLQRQSVQYSPAEPVEAQPEPSHTSADKPVGREPIATGEGDGSSPEPLPRAAGREVPARRAPGHSLPAGPNSFRQAAARATGQREGSMDRRGDALPEPGFGPSASAAQSDGAEELLADPVHRLPAESDAAVLSDGQPDQAGSGGAPLAEAAPGSREPVKGRAAGTRTPPTFPSGREAEWLPEAAPDSRAEPVRHQLHVAVEGPEGVRVDLRLSQTRGALHVRLASSQQALAEALRAEQHELERALLGAGWKAGGERPDAAHGSASLFHSQEGPRQMPGMRLAEMAAMPAPDTFAGSPDVMDGGSGRGRQHSASELRQEWLDLSALRRFSRKGGRNSR